MPIITRRVAAALLTASALAQLGHAWAQGLPPEGSTTLDEARRLHESGAAVLIDLREPDEHATGVAAGARLLPLSQLSRRAAEIPRNQPVLLICNTQNRSRRAHQALKDAGWSNLRYVHGGMSEWARRGWPMVKP
ncbi:rhodanese-like domain-containing protein [Ottowia sp.]|uniref:rhodanese-like domain-containing protein n=1 Tax=Ottowia sp. TaxID=1898956 RepID=UPI002B854D31|nr:rhodanese-like domain-containing protein [Ottowia sp.]HOB65509.1 rhodanese-like domain-containing protein [Ottowia sp.]HPZ57251.1 rhodanese-like domain-containing protein [Ottowia sp.]HQD48907.1 rhodanese-like domain-containing protein [Ottowia sp.]